MYIRIRPLAPWPTMLDAPIDTIRPTSTDRPWKAAVCEPGRYGYAMASANSQITTLAMRRVGRAVSLSSQPICSSPLSTRLNSEAAVAAIRRAMAKITHTSTSPGKAPMMAWKTSAATSNR
ncbi:hypothetical protein D3C72_1818480 [compost metagenome]